MHQLLRVALAAIVAATATDAHAAWYQAKSKHFLIYANEDPDELRDYAQKLERFDQAVRYIRHMPDPELTDAGRVTLFVLSDADSVEQLIGREGARGMYMTRASGSVAFVPRQGGQLVFGNSNTTGRTQELLTPQEIFFHEYAHHLQLEDTTMAIPTWAVEGFAEFFATAEVGKDGSVSIGKFPEYRWYGIGNRDSLPIEKIVGETYGENISLEQTDVLYAQGWLLTHYLAMTDGRKGQFSKYISGIQQGLTPLDSARAAFGDLAQLERELDGYQRQRHINGIRLDGRVIPIGDIVLRQLRPGEAAMMAVVIRSKRGVDQKTAPGIAAEARNIAASYPADPAVQSALAEADFDAGDYHGAEEAASRAIAADPRNVHALIYEGRARLALAEANPKTADWDAIRAWFTKANAVDTENPEPLALYYRSFLAAGQKPTSNAIDAMLYAADLAPRDVDLRMNAVALLIAENKLADARTVLGPVAFQPHLDAAVRAIASKMMAALARGDGKGALQLMNSGTGTAVKKE